MRRNYALSLTGRMTHLFVIPLTNHRLSSVLTAHPHTLALHPAISRITYLAFAISPMVVN
ncbi:hypothetical protein N7535_005945 [Penicillium sp. DV-2018c]|nr:hypothetical protein N7461_009523 [Penicillium sp. DV-2018c]KAJ5572285.1 hypothetical protein N7535_005945 [Penicillium sp. DV-2018c]